MVEHSHAIACTSMPEIPCELHAAWRDTQKPMDDNWFERFVIAVKRAEPRSMREISIAAKCGPNYIEQAINKRSNLRIEHFIRILNELGTASTLYIITGLEISAEAEKFLKVISDLDPDLREEALRFFEKLSATRHIAEPSSDPRGSA